MLCIKRPLLVLCCLFLCIGLFKLHCQGIPTNTTIATKPSAATASSTMSDNISSVRATSLQKDNSQAITGKHTSFATTATTSTNSNTSDYPERILAKNGTIDILVLPHVGLKDNLQMHAFNLHPRGTAATYHNGVNSAASAQKRIYVNMPNITADIKAARIYESFRLLPEDKSYNGVNDVEVTNKPRIRRFTEDVSYKNVTTTPASVRKRTASADMLSRNISIILENLLKSYEQSQLPTHGQGVPTIVRTNILIRSMGPVSELDMDYSMDCYFRQYWRDKRLSFQGPIKSLSLSIKMLDKIWRPDTYFFNGKHSHIHTITVPNKLLRLDQDGGILYSMRLTIKATCPMELKNFPMDLQSCPLIIGSYGYTSRQLVYEWKSEVGAVSFVPGMTLNQFDLISMKYRNFTYTRREGDFSVLHVAFNLKRHTGYFLIQVYVPCILIVVLSWVSFWIHREATSDRVGLCVTAVLTLSTISLDSRTDLPKVKYATALDWFLLMSFLYCIATLLEFAGVHYFTKVGSGEIPISEDEWEDIDENEVIVDDDMVEEVVDNLHSCSSKHSNESMNEFPATLSGNFRKRNAMICPIYNDPTHIFQAPSSHASTMERTTQTEPPMVSKARQMWLCFIGDDKFRKQRERDASVTKGARYVNSVSLIDRIARIGFPMSFAFFNLLYWLVYGMYKKEFSWSTVKG